MQTRKFPLYNSDINLSTLKQTIMYVKDIFIIFVYNIIDSKVNSLNEFKKQRSQLTEKFLKQEEELSKLKEDNNNLLYETEKKLIIAKEQ